MNADHHFWIGSTHAICEDYSTSGLYDGVPYAIICDGCSSSTDTDFGARILAKAAERCISSVYDLDINLFANNVLMQAKIISDAAQLQPSALDATLLIATPKFVRCYGDGVVATITESGTINVTNIEFPSGAPLYLNYLLDKPRYTGYRKTYGDKREVSSLSISPNGLNILRDVENKVPINDPTPIGIDVCVPNNAIAVAIMSDGVSSFVEDIYTDTSRTERPVPLHEVLEQLLAFKNYQGVFVKRRAMRFVKYCSALKWQNADDVSLAVVCR